MLYRKNVHFCVAWLIARCVRTFIPCQDEAWFPFWSTILYSELNETFSHDDERSRAAPAFSVITIQDFIVTIIIIFGQRRSEQDICILVLLPWKTQKSMSYCDSPEVTDLCVSVSPSSSRRSPAPPGGHAFLKLRAFSAGTSFSLADLHYQRANNQWQQRWVGYWIERESLFNCTESKVFGFLSF